MPSVVVATRIFLLVFQEQLPGHHKEDSTCEQKVLGLFTPEALELSFFDTESLCGKTGHILSLPVKKGNEETTGQQA